MSDRQETVAMLAEAVRRFTREVLIPAEAQVDAEEKIPESIVAQLKALGLFGLSIPEQYGGLGLTPYEEAQVVFEIGYAALAFRSYFGTSNGVGTLGLIIDGTEEQKKKYLPRVASGELMTSFCLSEPDAGSDVASIATRAVRDGDHYVINGMKRFTTNSPLAGLFTVYARTGPKEAGIDGISAFLVEKGTPGIQVQKPHEKMGLRGNLVADVVFENCRVPAATLLGGAEGIGFKTAMKALDVARIHMSAVATGLCDRLVDEGTRYALQRKQFGKPIADFQLVQAMLADSATEALACRAMVEKVAQMKSAGQTVTRQAASCKYFTTEAVGRIADRMLQVHGGYGYIKAYPVERLYRDVRILRIYEGTSQIMQLVIARQLLKEAAQLL